MYFYVTSRIRIGLDGIICLLLLPFCRITRSFFVLMLAAALHEAAHVAAIYLLGSDVALFTIGPAGAEIRQGRPLGDTKSFFVMLCGPASNLLFGGLSIIYMHIFGYNSDVLFFCVSSFSLALFNLLPIRALDGGQMLFFLLRGRLGRRIEKLLFVSSFLCVVLLWLLAMSMLLCGEVNVSLISVCIYLFFCFVW